MEAFLAQIDRVNPDVNAIITMIEPDAALALADAADKKLAAGDPSANSTVCQLHIRILLLPLECARHSVRHYTAISSRIRTR